MLVDDQSLFREALHTLLALQADFEIVAEAENGERAVVLAKTHQPDVILMDLRMAVLGMLADGCSNKEIGVRLTITEGTVKNHMTNVLGKLGVLDRTQAALKARELGLI